MANRHQRRAAAAIARSTPQPITVSLEQVQEILRMQEARFLRQERAIEHIAKELEAVKQALLVTDRRSWVTHSVLEDVAVNGSRTLDNVRTQVREKVDEYHALVERNHQAQAQAARAPAETVPEGSFTVEETSAPAPEASSIILP
jgi:hypothetical protein